MKLLFVVGLSFFAVFSTAAERRFFPSDSRYGGVYGEPGEPAIPALRFYVEGDGPIRIRPGPERTEKLRSALPPVPHPVPRLPGYRAPLARDPAAYARDEFLPGVSHRIEEAGRLRGRRRRLVTLFPLQYRPDTGQGRVTAWFDVEMPGPVYSAPPGETFGFIVDGKLENSPSLRRLMRFKESLGYRVRMAAGLSSPEAIRARLQQWYRDASAPLAYVLLVGDQSGVPGQVSDRLPEGYTDHYYRCLDADPYEADIGSPDVGVGRLSATNETELAILVEKNLRYETGHFADTGWLERYSFIATDDPIPVNWQMAEGTHEYALGTYATPAGYGGSFPSPAERGGDRLYAITHGATGADVLARLQEGRALVNYGGHGLWDRWSGPELTSAEVTRLSHPSALPFIASQACDTAQFQWDSFGETWQRHPQGSILFWGSMDALFWHPADDLLGRSMYDAIYRDGRLRFADFIHYSIGEAWRYLGGKGNSKYYWETYVILGDASLHFRTRAPRSVSLLGPRSVPPGTRSVELVVTAGGAPVAEARVGLSGAGHPTFALTGKDGRARVTLGGNATAGTRYEVTVSGPNLKMAFSELTVR